MAKCEVIDLTLSDSDSDGDFIQAKKAIHLFPYQLRLVNSCMYIVMYCSLTKSGRLICIVRSWEICFAMITSLVCTLVRGSSVAL